LQKSRSIMPSSAKYHWPDVCNPYIPISAEGTGLFSSPEDDLQGRAENVVRFRVGIVFCGSGGQPAGCGVARFRRSGSCFAIGLARARCAAHRGACFAARSDLLDDTVGPS
jgi:hypothetical protein